jgi:hypothetical protein
MAAALLSTKADALGHRILTSSHQCSLCAVYGEHGGKIAYLYAPGTYCVPLAEDTGVEAKYSKRSSTL